MKKILFLVIVLMLIIGCATTQPEPTSTPLPPTVPPSTPLPEPTNTSIPPTQLPEPSPTLPPPPIEARFDGNTCSVTTPTQLPAGEHTTILIDQSDLKAELWLVWLNEDNTIQDDDGQRVWYPEPLSIYADSRLSIESQESNGRRVTTTTWKLDRVGEYNFVCWVPAPPMLWIVAPLMIVETPSE